jgi:hypothetical protein
MCVSIDLKNTNNESYGTRLNSNQFSMWELRINNW